MSPSARPSAPDAPTLAAVRSFVARAIRPFAHEPGGAAHARVDRGPGV